MFKLRTRMLKLKTNFRNNTKGDILCPKSHKETVNEQRLFERCNQLEDLYQKYKIKSYKLKAITWKKNKWNSLNKKKYRNQYSGPK